MLIIILLGLSLILLLISGFVYIKLHRHSNVQLRLELQLTEFKLQHEKTMQTLHDKLSSTTRDLQQLLSNNFEKILKQIHQSNIEGLQHQQDSLRKNINELRTQITTTLRINSETINKGQENLTQVTERHLLGLSKQVEQRLSAGFEKTTATFTDVIKRLAMIDVAQQKISELSTNVVQLQDILIDKKSRGTFGEVQLSNLISNLIPARNFAMQHTLSNGRRADCILFLPEPSGNIVIDAKFPLENYRLMHDANSARADRDNAEKLFQQNIRKHIQDISSKYIIDGETSDGAIMFIPAEAIFADIHARFPQLVDYAQQAHVWLASPTTMMAILTTSKAVLKDAATKKQVNVIQQHLNLLAKDFSRFENRMSNLATHIAKVHQDVDDVNISAKKITTRFDKIERVELTKPADKLTTA